MDIVTGSLTSGTPTDETVTSDPFDGGADKAMQPPDEPAYFPEKWPGKLCALCNLGERSQLGQGEMLRIEVGDTTHVLNQQMQPLSSDEKDNVQLADEKCPRDTPLAPPINNRRQKGQNKCKNPINTEYVDELEKIGHPELIDLSFLYDGNYIYVHRSCAAWSSGVIRDVLGSITEIPTAVIAALNRKCVYCNRFGASLVCKMSCSKSFHLPCIAASGGFQLIQNYTIFCKEHLHCINTVYTEDINCRSCSTQGDVSNLMMCTSCGDHYHGACIGLAQLPGVRTGWQCKSCKKCQICRIPDLAEGRSVACEQCDKIYHANCLRPIMTSIPKIGWKCRCCRLCSDCGARTPGAGTSSRWHAHYTVCDSCYQQRNKGYSCPICHRAYRALAQKEMVRCNLCRKHVHSMCDPEADLTTYELKKELNPDYEYICAHCKSAGPSRLAMMRRNSAMEDESMSASQESLIDDLDLDSESSKSSTMDIAGFGKGKPFAANKIAKKRLGLQGNRPKGAGKLAFQKRPRLAEFGRKRGPKSKMRGIFGVPGLGLQRPTNDSNKSEDESRNEENRLVLCSAKDKFVLYQDICVMCGAIGTNQEGCLIACVQCGQCYHPYCVNVKLTMVILERGWRCPDCIVCEECGQRNDDSLLILCDDCDISYHTYCVQPPLDNVPTGNWKCKWCAICLKCGSNDPGLNSAWQSSYTECGPCASKENCPLCGHCYNDGELIIQCQKCDRWLHGLCDSIRNEDEAHKCSDDGYICKLCRPTNVLPPHLIVKKKLVSISTEGKAKSTDDSGDLLVSLGLGGSHPLDGVYLSEHGMQHIKSLQLEMIRKKRKNKSPLDPPPPPPPSNEKEAAIYAAIESVIAGGLDTSLEDANADGKEEVENYKDGMVWDRESTMAPEGFSLVRNEQGVLVLRKKRQRNLQKLGIGGFSVRNRNMRKDDNAKDEDDGDINMEMKSSTLNGDGSTEKKKKVIRKKQKNKISETYPSYIQEAFFGKPLLECPKEKLDISGSEDESKLHNLDDKTIKLSNEEIKVIESMQMKAKIQGSIIQSQSHVDTICHVKEHSVSNDSINYGMPKSTSSVINKPQQSISIGANEIDSQPNLTVEKSKIKSELLDKLSNDIDDSFDNLLLSNDFPELDSIINEADLTKDIQEDNTHLDSKEDLDLFNTNFDFDCKMVDELMEAVRSQDAHVQQSSKGNVKSTVQSNIVENTENMMKMTKNVTMSSQIENQPIKTISKSSGTFQTTVPMQMQNMQQQPMQMLSGQHNTIQRQNSQPLGNPHFNQMFSEPNDESIWKMEMQNDIPGQMSQSLPTTPMTPSPIEDAVPSGSMTTPSTYGAKSSEKNQIDETLGELATNSAVLYANMIHPELKAEFPNWSDRYRQILKKWRALTAEKRQPYLQKARDNRSLLKMHKAQQDHEKNNNPQKTIKEQEQERMWKQLQANRAKEQQINHPMMDHKLSVDNINTITMQSSMPDGNGLNSSSTPSHMNLNTPFMAPTNKPRMPISVIGQNQQQIQGQQSFSSHGISRPVSVQIPRTGIQQKMGQTSSFSPQTTSLHEQVPLSPIQHVGNMESFSRPQTDSPQDPYIQSPQTPRTFGHQSPNAPGRSPAYQGQIMTNQNQGIRVNTAGGYNHTPGTPRPQFNSDTVRPTVYGPVGMFNNNQQNSPFTSPRADHYPQSPVNENNRQLRDLLQRHQSVTPTGIINSQTLPQTLITQQQNQQMNQGNIQGTISSNLQQNTWIQSPVTDQNGQQVQQSQSIPVNQQSNQMQISLHTISDNITFRQPLPPNIASRPQRMAVANQGIRQIHMNQSQMPRGLILQPDVRQRMIRHPVTGQLQPMNQSQIINQVQMQQVHQQQQQPNHSMTNIMGQVQHQTQLRNQQNQQGINQVQIQGQRVELVSEFNEYLIQNQPMNQQQVPIQQTVHQPTSEQQNALDELQAAQQKLANSGTTNLISEGSEIPDHVTEELEKLEQEENAGIGEVEGVDLLGSLEEDDEVLFNAISADFNILEYADPELNDDDDKTNILDSLDLIGDNAEEDDEKQSKKDVTSNDKIGNPVSVSGLIDYNIQNVNHQRVSTSNPTLSNTSQQQPLGSDSDMYQMNSTMIQQSHSDQIIVQNTNSQPNMNTQQQQQQQQLQMRRSVQFPHMLGQQQQQHQINQQQLQGFDSSMGNTGQQIVMKNDVITNQNNLGSYQTIQRGQMPNQIIAQQRIHQIRGISPQTMVQANMNQSTGSRIVLQQMPGGRMISRIPQQIQPNHTQQALQQNHMAVRNNTAQQQPPPPPYPGPPPPYPGNNQIIGQEQPLLLEDLLEQEKREQEQHHLVAGNVPTSDLGNQQSGIDNILTDQDYQAMRVDLDVLNTDSQNLLPMTQQQVNQLPGTSSGSVRPPGQMQQSNQQQTQWQTPQPKLETNSKQSVAKQNAINKNVIPTNCSVPLFIANLTPAPTVPPENIVTEQDRHQQITYETWLNSQNNQLSNQLKYYEEEIGKLRKSRKSLNSKKRTLNKTGGDLNAVDSNELARVTADQTFIQKQLENARKQSRQHGLLLQDYKTKRAKVLGQSAPSPATPAPPSPLMQPSPGSQSGLHMVQSPMGNAMIQSVRSPLASPSPLMSQSPGPASVNSVLQSPSTQGNSNMSPYSNMQQSPRIGTPHINPEENPFSPSSTGPVPSPSLPSRLMSPGPRMTSPQHRVGSGQIVSQRLMTSPSQNFGQQNQLMMNQQMQNTRFARPQSVGIQSMSGSRFAIVQQNQQMNQMQQQHQMNQQQPHQQHHLIRSNSNGYVSPLGSPQATMSPSQSNVAQQMNDSMYNQRMQMAQQRQMLQQQQRQQLMLQQQLSKSSPIHQPQSPLINNTNQPSSPMPRSPMVHYSNQQQQQQQQQQQMQQQIITNSPLMRRTPSINDMTNSPIMQELQHNIDNSPRNQYIQQNAMEQMQIQQSNDNLDSLQHHMNG